MCHMTYLRELFDRTQQGDVVVRAMSAAISAIDPGLQLTFVFGPEATAALKDGGKIPDDAEPQALQIRLNAAKSQGIQHPCLVAAQLRRIAEDLDDVAMAAVAKMAEVAEAAAAKPPVTAADADDAKPAEAPAALPPQ